MCVRGAPRKQMRAGVDQGLIKAVDDAAAEFALDDTLFLRIFFMTPCFLRILLMTLCFLKILLMPPCA